MPKKQINVKKTLKIPIKMQKKVKKTLKMQKNEKQRKENSKFL